MKQLDTQTEKSESVLITISEKSQNKMAAASVKVNPFSMAALLAPSAASAKESSSETNNNNVTSSSTSDKKNAKKIRFLGGQRGSREQDRNQDGGAADETASNATELDVCVDSDGEEMIEDNHHHLGSDDEDEDRPGSALSSDCPSDKSRDTSPGPHYTSSYGGPPPPSHTIHHPFPHHPGLYSPDHIKLEHAAAMAAGRPAWPGGPPPGMIGMSGGPPGAGGPPPGLGPNGIPNYHSWLAQTAAAAGKQREEIN